MLLLALALDRLLDRHRKISPSLLGAAHETHVPGNNLPPPKILFG